MRNIVLCIIGLSACILQPLHAEGALPENVPVTEEWTVKVDSMEALLGNRSTIEEGFTLCHIGAAYFRNFKADKSLGYAEEALRIGKEKSSDSLILLALRLYADSYYSLCKFDLSTDYFLQQLEYYKKDNNWQKIAEVYCNLGVNYEIRGMLEKGMSYYYQARRIYEELGDMEGLWATYCNMAYVFRSQGRIDAAIRHFKTALEIERKHLADQRPYYFHVNIAECQLLIEEYDSARSNLDSALLLIGDLASPDDEDILVLTDCNRIYGDLLHRLGSSEEAEQKYIQALELARAIHYLDKEGEAIAALSHLLIEQGRYRQAESYLKRGEEIAEEIGSFYLKRDIYQSMSVVAGNQHHFREAWLYHQKYSAASDSVLNLESAGQIADLQVRYETEKKENQILMLTRDKESQDRLHAKENEIRDLRLQKSENKTIYIGIVALLFLALAIITFSRYRIRRKNSLLMEAKNRELQTLNATKDKFFTIIAHDLKNPVAAFYTLAGEIAANFELFSKDELKEFIGELAVSSASLFEMLKNLLDWAKMQLKQFQPEFRETTGEKIMQRAQREAVGQRQDVRIKLIRDLEGDQAIMTDENILVTVLRNLLHNAIKFSPANGSITIQKLQENGNILFRVSDEGPGMKSDDIDKLFRIDVDTKTIGSPEGKGTGLGLILCHELMHKLGGGIEVESTPKKGSTFTVSVPLSLSDLHQHAN
ncbi:MAG: tetratricopeptide repeat protein [Bacteroidales bacterium]|nr:tetratricopeptide repeat protein [Bacteroidales bacterium]